ncbi:hypothetical protein NA78x_004723 [Anatilimnocola sp. NA78]|uniref:hypothetical protein n=1 Tax=Anatilimnocola sp. NA78 TaxID=3415683 RepID=UPI003CE4B4FD
MPAKQVWWLILAMGLCCLTATQQLHAQLPVEGPGVADVVAFERYDEELRGFVLHKTFSRLATVVETSINPAGVEESRTVVVPELVTEALHISSAETIVTTVGGKEIKSAEAAKQLKKGQVVIMISRGTQLPANLKSLLRDDAIVFEIADRTTPAKPRYLQIGLALSRLSNNPRVLEGKTKYSARMAFTRMQARTEFLDKYE